MGFCISTCSMTYIRSYADAKEHFERTQALRGSSWKDSPTIRPLGHSREWHKRIEKHGDRYDCVLYKTALVSYYEDGMVKVNLDNSVSSRLFMDVVLPRGILSTSHQGRTMLRVDTPTGTQWIQGAEVRFTPAPGSNLWTVVGGAEQRRRETLDRKKAAEIRKAAAPFFLWVEANRKLGVTPIGRYAPSTIFQEAVPKTLEGVKDPEGWSDLEPLAWSKALLNQLYINLGASTLVDVDNHEPLKRFSNNGTHFTHFTFLT